MRLTTDLYRICGTPTSNSLSHTRTHTHTHSDVHCFTYPNKFDIMLDLFLISFCNRSVKIRLIFVSVNNFVGLSVLSVLVIHHSAFKVHLFPLISLRCVTTHTSVVLRNPIPCRTITFSRSLRSYTEKSVVLHGPTLITAFYEQCLSFVHPSCRLAL